MKNTLESLNHTVEAVLALEKPEDKMELKAQAWNGRIVVPDLNK